jgi:hypothetical protein
VNGNAGAAIGSGRSQAIKLFTLGTRGVVVSVEAKTTIAWHGTGFTSFGATIGDSVGGGTYYLPFGYDLTIAAGNTNFVNSGPLFKHATYGGSDVQFVVTANQALNTTVITGATDVDVCWNALP